MRSLCYAFGSFMPLRVFLRHAGRRDVSRVFCEFLEVAVHQILFTRNVYPAELFERKRFATRPIFYRPCFALMQTILLALPMSLKDTDRSCSCPIAPMHLTSSLPVQQVQCSRTAESAQGPQRIRCKRRSLAFGSLGWAEVRLGWTEVGSQRRRTVFLIDCAPNVPHAILIISRA